LTGESELTSETSRHWLRTAAVLFALVACSTLTACDGTSGGTSSDVGGVVAHSVSWAPDGELLAFIGWDGAYVVRPTGRGLSRVAEGDVHDAAWAPSRRELALVVLERAGEDPIAGINEIELVDVASSERRNLSRSPADDVDPAWSPDGERVVFSSNRAGNYDLYVVRRDGRGLRRLTRNPARESVPAWSPDGHTIMFRREGGSRVPFSGGTESIVRISADGARERVLLSMDPRESLNRCCWRVRWSPDGRRVALDLGASIRVIDLASGRSTFLARRGTAPIWSPDATHILFEAWEPRDCSGVGGLCIEFRVAGPWVMRADGSRRFSLATTAKLPSVVTVGSSWSPDGRMIATVLDVNGGRSIIVVKADGSHFRRLDLVKSAEAG
jgi:Tol biopolymer transport system component